ncbi:MAG: hypothetical protein C0483_00965 [Pirellula sp.]|nr:hypothetical protein [Pirellula sp.]
MRVGALTNKGAHYVFTLVRTGQGAVRGLTSIGSATGSSNCRERRGISRSVVGDVRGAAHLAERRGGRFMWKNARSGHEMVGSAQQTA